MVSVAAVVVMTVVFVPSPRSSDDSRLLTELIEVELRSRFKSPLAPAPVPPPALAPAPPPPPLKLPLLGLRPSALRPPRWPSG